MSNELEQIITEGDFRASLKRNNRQIKDDRADAIAEDAEMSYRRRIEDLKIDMRRLERERNNMLDLSPENKMSLMLASDFDSKKFVEKDEQIGMELRNMTIQFKILSERYTSLFGGTV